MNGWKNMNQDFSGGPVVGNLPSSAGMWVQSLLRELRLHMLCATTTEPVYPVGHVAQLEKDPSCNKQGPMQPDKKIFKK